jgi:transcriptional regulator with XRE-family HTH domain
MSEQSEAWGRHLRKLREERGVTKYGLWKASGITSKNTIGRYETGLVEPGFDSLLRLATALEVSLDELMRVPGR